MLKLGATLRDKVSGFTGIAHSKTEFLTGNVQFSLQPPAKDGTLPEVIGFDAHQLEESPGAVVPNIAPSAAGLALVLGEKFKDMITKFEGIATRRTTFLNGCVYYVVLNEETIDKTGKKEGPQEMFLEWSRLERVGAGVSTKIAKKLEPVTTTARKPGGPNARGMAARG